MLKKTFSIYKKTNDYSSNELLQNALKIFIESGIFYRHIKNIKSIYSSRMNELLKSCKKYLYPNIKYNIPDTGFFANIELPDNNNTERLLSKLYTEDLFIRNTKDMYLPGFPHKKQLRVSISNIESEKIDTGTQLIAKEIMSLSDSGNFKLDNIF